MSITPSIDYIYRLCINLIIRMKPVKALCLLCYILCLYVQAFAQQDSSVAPPRKDSVFIVAPPADTASIAYIAGISFYGNDKTKSYILQRELGFKQGDYVEAKDLPQKLVEARQQLINTSLFINVDVHVENKFGELVFITINVKERWYLFPLPYFKLADRNFNTWLVTYNASLQRVNYGIKFIHNNFSGRNDKMNLWLITGYTRQAAFKYERPYANKSLTTGYNIYFNYGSQRELNYGSSQSKQIFFKQDNFVRKSVRAEVDYVYRPAIRTRHIVRFSFYHDEVSDTVLKLNPNYFSGARSVVNYPEIGYSIQYRGADYFAYPTTGLNAEVSIAHKGFGISGVNLTQLNFTGSYAQPIAKNDVLLLQAGGILKLPFNQPFYTKTLFGYGGANIFLQGMEYYVIDGVAGGVGRATWRHRLLQFNLKAPEKLKKNISIPFSFFAKIYGNMGYAYDKYPGNALFNNKFLYSYGFGVDIVAVYDLVFKFDYSFNQLGENGFFFHVRTDF